jgi:hypothetical protein
MNKIMTISILFLFVSFPVTSESREIDINEVLYSYGEKLSSNYIRLENISKDLIAITETCNCSTKEYHDINYSLLHIIFINTIIIYESEQLKITKIIDTIFKSQFFERKKKFLEIAESNIDGRLKKIQMLNADMENKAALLSLSQARDISRDSLRIIKKCIEILSNKSTK